jgi:hypothetical protein
MVCFWTVRFLYRDDLKLRRALEVRLFVRVRDLNYV